CTRAPAPYWGDSGSLDVW
nr:immunoglobulin heavy chain junction region [Macaca mulatta]MOW86915.1 immunoglobulin heavy chain junction region [Macaca mulatta]MOW87056.1 immunoglobulin heavy chain junction region [Macaca mulatta]MOW87361.1 immunoglobulin heavy chain junction region [Macaca mulatta]MOW87674.1 immunoglobulin heavy chain junction region [Macaca mulatta]